jgi:hypothetical protein
MYSAKRIDMKKIGDNSGGQILIFVLFLLFLVGFIGTALAALWQSDARLRTLDQDGLTAFYAAQAGLEHGQLYAENHWTASGWFPASSCQYDDETDVHVAGNASCWYSSITGARYRFKIYSSTSGYFWWLRRFRWFWLFNPGGRKVWAQGQAYRDGTVLAGKQIENNLDYTESWQEK